jgi:hypothetical protein
MGNSITYQVFPSQRKSDREKTKKWGEECIDAAESLILVQNQYVRNSRYSKVINYDLYANRIHPSDFELIVGDIGLKDIEFPATVANHPLINPYIKSLIGEEIKRRFDFHIRVENEDAISEKEKAKKDIINKTIEELLLQGLEMPQVDPNTQEGQTAMKQYQDEVAKRLEQKTKYINYEWQDIRELAGNRLLRYYSEKNNIKEAFTKGWEDALLVAEEIYCIEIINNEPFVRKCNPLNTYFLLPPDSCKVEDADMIIEERYLPLSYIVDTFYDELTPANIDFLESKTLYKGKANYGGIPNYELQDPLFAVPLGATAGINVNQIATGVNNFMPFDSQSNVRIVKVVWRSLRKIGILSYFDLTTGNMEKMQVHEYYKPNKDAGETVKWLWIGEWWEGTKIANEIYVGVKPRPVQFRSLNDLSKCASGYVGSVYKTNSSVPVSITDLMKPYQYLYNIIYHKTKEAFAKNIGKVAKLDLAKIPDGWEVDKWLFYLKRMNLAVEDSFKEAKKGAATGKLAGNMSGQQSTIDLDMGNYIQQHVEMLEYIKQEIDLITGINAQRRGLVKTSAGLGVTQEAQEASATITEWYFKIHDNTKLRVLAALLETAKYCLREGNKTIQYIEDDMTTQIYTVDSELINEVEYGMMLRDPLQDAEAINMLRKATEIALQTQAVDIVQLMDIYSNQSLGSIRRKIEKSVSDKEQALAQQQQAQLDSQKENTQAQIQAEQERFYAEQEMKQQELDLKKYEIDTRAQTEIFKAELMTYMGAEDVDKDDNGIPDPLEIAKHALDVNKADREDFNKERDRKHKENIEKTKNDLKARELEFKKNLEDRKLRIEQEKLMNERLNMANDLAIAKQNRIGRNQSKPKK